MIEVKFLINNNLNNLLDYDKYHIVTKNFDDNHFQTGRYLLNLSKC